MPRQSKKLETPAPNSEVTTPTPAKEKAPAKPKAVAKPKAAVKAAKEPAVKDAPAIKPAPAAKKSAAVKAPAKKVAAKPAKPKKADAAPKVEPVSVAEPVVEAPAPKKPSSRSPRPAKKAAAKAAPPAEEVPLGARDADDLPIPTWRPVQKRTRHAQPQADKAAEPQERTERNGRGRRGRGRGRQEELTPAVASEPAEELTGFEDLLPTPIFRKKGGGEPTPEREPTRERGRRGQRAPRTEPERAKEPERPKTPLKARVPIPADAPQVVLRDGIPTLVRNGRVYPPMGFFGNTLDEKRAETVFGEMKLASEAGIHVHSFIVELEVNPQAVDPAVQLSGYLVKKAKSIDPNAQVILRVVFVAPNGWEQRYPGARYNGLRGEPAEPSLCDEEYWGVARQCLDAFVRKLRLLGDRDSILGVHLERGEWFVPVDGGYDDSPSARAKFKDWARTRYSEDEVALRASWFDGGVKFDTVQIPPYQPEGAEGDRFVRSSRKQRRYVDYHLFLSDSTVERLSDLAYAVKQASEGYFLAGASYGYTFEWAHPSSGHLALGKLLRTHEIDFIAGPPSYKNREPGGSGPFPTAIDSFALNGKLYISEEDFKTAIGTGTEPDEFNPVIRTPQALESIHWRGAGAALAHGSGVTWMDLWGNGWLKTASIWERAEQIRQALVTRMAVPISDPDVAVFVDERALAYLVDPNAFRLLIQNAREAALRSGLSVGFYLLSDLAHRERFPECKLYLFLNAWDIRPDLRSAIKERLHRDKKVLFWLYSAGLFDAGRDSLERARDVTGIALKPQPFHSKSGTTILNRRHPLADAFPSRTIPSSALEPSYFGINEEALVLGEYTQTGLPSFLLKEFNETSEGGGQWTSVFLGEPAVNPALIRALGEMAGAHIWNFQDDVVHVRPPFLVVHCREAGPRTITLPSKWSAYNLLSQEWEAQDTTHLRFSATAGSTHVFLVGIHGELEQLLANDPDSVLTMLNLPERSDNTVQFDAVSFDVPIMRMNEWIEGGVTDEVVEELLFRPKFDAEEAAAPDEPENRTPGRRRRRRGGRGGSEETSAPRRETADMQFAELDLGVHFRKRE